MQMIRAKSLRYKSYGIVIVCYNSIIILVFRMSYYGKVLFPIICCSLYEEGQQRVNG